MKRWNLINPCDETTLPPVGKRVLVISNERLPYITERRPGEMNIYCLNRDDNRVAVWWTYLPPQIGKTYTVGDPEGEI